MNEGYNKYKNDIVFIVATLVPLDTYEKISALYLQKSGVANDFPLVTFAGKGRELATLLGFPAGGQVHIIHPTREFERGIGDTPYKQPYLNNAIQAALDDDCDKGSGTTYELTVTNGSGDGEHEEGATITITADAAPEGKQFDTWTGDTDYLANAKSATTTVTMPKQNITVTATYKDKGSIVKKDNYLAISSWESATGDQGSSISIDSSKKADTLLTVSFNLAGSNSAEEKWAWAHISGYANSDFSEVKSVELTYAATEPVNIVLDQEGLAEKGESYRYLLPAQELGSIKIGIDEFKQPSYITGDKQTDLDLTKVLSVSFSATKEKATTDLELQGVFLEGFKETAILSSATHNVQQLSVTSLSKEKLQLTQVPSNEYTIEIYSITGKALYKTHSTLKGNCTLSFGNTPLTSGVYILHIKSNALSMVVKSSVL